MVWGYEAHLLYDFIISAEQMQGPAKQLVALGDCLGDLLQRDAAGSTAWKSPGVRRGGVGPLATRHLPSTARVSARREQNAALTETPPHRLF